MHLELSETDLQKFAKVAIAAALDAGQIIMEIYAGVIETRIKSDASPVTDADEAAEAIILHQLALAFPEIPVVSEEAASMGKYPDIGKTFVLVDPLDGTKEFISRNGEFTVNIAIVQDNFPVLGVVFAPVLGDLYLGIVGEGAWKAKTGMAPYVYGSLDWSSIRVTSEMSNPGAVGSRSHQDQKTRDYLEQFSISGIKPMGSSLKFCIIASGEADLYPRFGRTMEWDTAAGDAVLAAAGGMVLTPEGNPFEYGKLVQDDAPFANGPFVASNGCSKTILGNQ